VADAPTDKSKKTTQAPPAPTKVDTIIWHIYETLIKPQPGNPKGFSKQDFFDWFQAPDDSRITDGPGKWSHAGIKLRHPDLPLN
jgi:hypothetical protein